MKSRNVLFFFVLVLALLALACWLMPTDGLQIGAVTIRTPRLSQVMQQDEEVPLPPPVDTVEMARLQEHRDSIELFEHWKDSSIVRFWLPNDDETFFDNLFAAMETAARQGRHLRVMHYGDSQIEMDHISSRLRSSLQHLFGGSGAGIVPLQSFVPTPSVSLWSSRQLTRLAPFGDSLSVRSRGNYGLLAQCSRLDGEVSTQIRLGGNKHCDPRVGQCTHVGVIYHLRGTTLSSSLAIQKPYSCAATPPATQRMSIDQQVGLALWQPDSAVTRIRLALNGSADIYGVILDGDPGVMVDNIPLRGCSGYEFSKIDSALLADAYSLLDIGCIVMQFGGNALPYLKGGKARTTYCKNIGRQIDRLHHCCPQATILFVGPADMSTSINGTLQSYSHIEALITELRDTVNAHNAAYWSQYHAMGGYNSMLRWSQQGLAGADYIHFSQKGADKMGDLLSEALENMYQYYLLRRKPSHIQP